MAPPRRKVQFAHRQAMSTALEERRDSMSSSGSSKEGNTSNPSSPMKSSREGFKSSEMVDVDGTWNDDEDDSTMAIDLKHPKPAEPSEYEKKKATFITRTVWTLVMIFVFFAAMAAGHLYLVAIVTAVQVLTFKEVISIATVPAKEKKLAFTKSLNWYFLAATIYFLYGESVIYYFKHIVLVDVFLLPFATHHRFISFMLYIMGFVFFVATLKKGHYKFQFTQFAWTHMALYLVVVQAHFIMNNVFEGMIWFFLPVSLVITNDIFAYICGITFGRTQLIKISPKKTVEGFVGAWVCTVVFGWGMAAYLARFPYFICPVKDLGANVFTGLSCEPNPVFLPHPVTLPLGLGTWSIAPLTFHIFVMATFASLIAPFGGFFASGLKRTFKIKDFGETIPGHGGITDRMDCQFIMGFFSNLYYQSFIAVHTKVSVGMVLQTVVESLSEQEQKEVVGGLLKLLAGRGVVGERVLECWAEAGGRVTASSTRVFEAMKTAAMGS